MQQQEIMIENINPGLLLMKVVNQINQSKKRPTITANLPVVAHDTEPVNVTNLVELEIAKGRTFKTMEEKWAFEERLARGCNK